MSTFEIVETSLVVDGLGRDWLVAQGVGEMLVGISAKLQRLLEQHDGESRSIPSRINGGALVPVIESSDDEGETNGSGNGELH